MVKSKDQIITDLLNREGGYVNDPADPGGATNYGITQYSWDLYHHKLDLILDNVRFVTAAQARAYYQSEYWDVYGPIFFTPGRPIGDPTGMSLIELVIDSAVNHGKIRVNKWLQRATKQVQDGALGPVSVSAIRMTDYGSIALDILAYRIQEYGRLITQMPSLAKFAAGWMNRVTGFMVTT